MLLGDESAPVTWQSASRIPHGGIAAFCSSAVYLFLQTPTMLKTLAVINRVAEHGLFSCTFNLIDHILRYPVCHHSYVASRFTHQFGGLSCLECAKSVYPTVGHTSSPDEAIHLAAAMQFSGFRSVTGFMWSADDDVVPQLISPSMATCLTAKGHCDCTYTAVGLRKAMKKTCKEIPLE